MDARTLCDADDLATHLLIDTMSFKCHKMDVNFEDSSAWTKRCCKQIVAVFLTSCDHDATVDALLKLKYVQCYLSARQLDADAARLLLDKYLRVHHIASGIRIQVDHRYSSEHWLGGQVVATRPWKPLSRVSALNGVMVPISRQLEEELIIDGRNDFSILWSCRSNSASLLLGPVAFINHDCQPNCRLDFSNCQPVVHTLRYVEADEPLTIFYGHNYFGKNNADCRCSSCGYSIAQPSSDENKLSAAYTLRSRNSGGPPTGSLYSGRLRSRITH